MIAKVLFGLQNEIRMRMRMRIEWNKKNSII